MYDIFEMIHEEFINSDEFDNFLYDIYHYNPSPQDN